MAQKKIIMWDIDGVLFHSYDEDGNFYWSANIYNDMPISEAAQKEIFLGGWHDVLRGKKDTKKYIGEIFEKHGLSISVDDYVDYWISKDSLINENVAQFLDKGTSFVATNQDPLRAKEVAQLLAGRIKKLYASSSIGALKSEQAYYDYVERDLGVSPADIILIDDSRVNIEVAALRGWHAHHYTNVERLGDFLTEQN